MPVGAAVHIVTGVPFSGAVFNNGTSTFTLTGQNRTSVFTTGSIITIFGTGTSNDGYYQVVTSVFSGGNTIVTVSSYSTGTVYPGTVPFVSSGTGTALWLLGSAGGPHYQDTLPSSWTKEAGPTYGAVTFDTVVPGFSSGAIASSILVYAESTTSPWTLTPITTTHRPIGKDPASGKYYSDILTDGGNTFYSTDLVNWTSASHPTGYQQGQSFYRYINDGTTTVLIYSNKPGVPNIYNIRSSRFTGTGWTAPITIVSGQNVPNFTAGVAVTGSYFMMVFSDPQHLYITTDSGASWGHDGDLVFPTSPNYSGGIVFDGTDWWLLNGTSGNVDTAPDYTGGTFPHNIDPGTITTDAYVPTNLSLDFIDVANGNAFAAGTQSVIPSNDYITSIGGNNGIPGYATLSDATERTFVTDPYVAPPFSIDLVNGPYSLTGISYVAGKYYAQSTGFSGGEVVTSASITGPWTTAVSGSLGLEGADLYAVKGDNVHNVVAVGDFGSIISSTNSGNSWSLRSTPVGVIGGLYSVAFGANIFVIAGSDSTNSILLSSPTGVTWTDHSIADDGGLFSVAFGNSKFVAVGSSWNYSTNGTSWTPATTSSFWGGVNFVNNRFVTVGQGSDGPLAYSTDGSTINNPLSSDANTQLRDVTFGGGTYVAVGYDGTNQLAKIVYSTNGTTWNYATVGVTGNINVQYVTYGNGLFVAAAQDQDNNWVVAFSSSDGINWTQTALSSYTSRDVAGMAWDGTHYLLSLYNPDSTKAVNTNVLTSTNGTSWSLDSTTVDSSLYGGIYASAGLTCGVGQAGTVIVRSNLL